MYLAWKRGRLKTAKIEAFTMFYGDRETLMHMACLKAHPLSERAFAESRSFYMTKGYFIGLSIHNGRTLSTKILTLKFCDNSYQQKLIQNKLVK